MTLAIIAALSLEGAYDLPVCDSMQSKQRRTEEAHPVEGPEHRTDSHKHYAEEGRANELYEILCVADTDTIVDPNAVMIHLNS
jgi:hypothetical protein